MLVFQAKFGVGDRGIFQYLWQKIMYVMPLKGVWGWKPLPGKILSFLNCSPHSLIRLIQ